MTAPTDEDLFRIGLDVFERAGVEISYSRLRREIKRWRKSEADREFGEWLLSTGKGRHRRFGEAFDPTGEQVARTLDGRHD